MNYKEFGKENKDTIILLHGGGLSWWNYRKEVELLKNSFHIVVPILDGHSGSDRHFTTIRSNAEEIISFVDDTYHGHVLLIGGLSLGAQILLDIMSIRNDICDYAIVESALCIPSKLTHAMIGPAIASSYSLIKKEWFSLLQFKYLKMDDSLFQDYFKDTCAISKEDMIAFMKENTIYRIKDTLANSKPVTKIIIGAKEGLSIKQSAVMINKAISGSTLSIIPQLYHGEFSINNPEKYVEEIHNLISIR